MCPCLGQRCIHYNCSNGRGGYNYFQDTTIIIIFRLLFEGSYHFTYIHLKNFCDHPLLARNSLLPCCQSNSGGHESNAARCRDGESVSTLCLEGSECWSGCHGIHLLVPEPFPPVGFSMQLPVASETLSIISISLFLWEILLLSLFLYFYKVQTCEHKPCNTSLHQKYRAMNTRPNMTVLMHDTPCARVSHASRQVSYGYY